MSQPSNRRAYTALLAYPNPESISYDELAKSLKVPRVKLQELAGALFKGAPRALLELKEAGYTLAELPSLIGSKPQKSQRSLSRAWRSHLHRSHEPEGRPSLSPIGAWRNPLLRS